MSDPEIPQNPNAADADESFADILSQYEQSHKRRAEDGTRQIEGTVISLTSESVFLDIGYKIEGVLPSTAFGETPPEPGDKISVTVKGRNEEGYYELSRFKVAQPTDWTSLERAFAGKSTIIGTVTGVVKGGLTVDSACARFCPLRAAAPAMPPRWRSWSGRKSAAALQSSTPPTKTWWSTAAPCWKKKSVPARSSVMPNCRKETL